MSDQCKHCTVQGDMPACINTPCSQHASWFAKAQSSGLSRAYALIEEMREALRGVTRIATAASIGVPGNKPRIGRAKSCIEAADAFLAERVK